MITKTVLLPCAVDVAFRLFSERIDEWWPPERRHAPEPSVVMLDAHRFAEQGADGVLVELGVVRAWAPPERILLDWYPGTDPEHPTEVEILFLREGEKTRLELRHRAGPNSGDLFPSTISPL